MPTIIIQGTPIEIPNSAASPNWSEGIIQAFQAIEAALNAVVGTYDVPPQSMSIDSYNPGSNVDITNLAFPTSNVRSAFIRYAVYRTTSTTVAYETGDLEIVYDSSSGSWEISRSFTGDGKISFDITNTGQVRLSTETLGGINHAGILTYSANALENS